MDGACSGRGEVRNAYKILVGKHERKRPPVEWVLGKQGGKVWTGCIWLRIGTRCGVL
jgi:hypothetical protein